MLLARIHSYTALLIVYMGIISLSYQAEFMDGTMVVANSWFIRKRALAMSLTSGSIALGGTLVTPFLAYAIHAWGWRSAVIAAGVAFLNGRPAAVVIAAPLARKHGLVAGWRAVAQNHVGKRIDNRTGLAGKRGGLVFATNLAHASVLAAFDCHHIARSLLQLRLASLRADPGLAWARCRLLS